PLGASPAYTGEAARPAVAAEGHAGRPLEQPGDVGPLHGLDLSVGENGQRLSRFSSVLPNTVGKNCNDSAGRRYATGAVLSLTRLLRRRGRRPRQKSQ